MNRRFRSTIFLPAGMILLLACGGAVPIRAEDPAPAEAAATSDPAGSEEASARAAPAPIPSQGGGPGLDSLLTLPRHRTYAIERRGGLTSGEWRAKFARARSNLVEAQVALEDSERRMDDAADRGQWRVSPPIPGQDQAAPGETSLDFNLRQEIRRHRAEITRLERRLQDLEIEANLAAVPEEWRG